MPPQESAIDTWTRMHGAAPKSSRDMDLMERTVPGLVPSRIDPRNPMGDPNSGGGDPRLAMLSESGAGGFAGGFPDGPIAPEELGPAAALGAGLAPMPAPNGGGPGALVTLPAPVAPSSSRLELLEGNPRRGQQFDVTGGLTADLTALANGVGQPMPPTALPGAEPIVTPRSTRLQPHNPTANPTTDPLAQYLEATAPKVPSQGPGIDPGLSPAEEYDIRPQEKISKWRQVAEAIGQGLQAVVAGANNRQYTPGVTLQDRQRAEREREIAEIDRNRQWKYGQEDRDLVRRKGEADIEESNARAEKYRQEPPENSNFVMHGGSPDQKVVAIQNKKTGEVRFEANPNYSGPKPKVLGSEIWERKDDGSEYASTVVLNTDGTITTQPILGSDGQQMRRAPTPDKVTSGDRTYDENTAYNQYIGSAEGKQKRQYIIGNNQYARLQAIDPSLGPANVDAELRKLDAAAAMPPPASVRNEQGKIAYQREVEAAKARAALIRQALAEGEKAGVAEWEADARSKVAGSGGGAGRGPSGRQGTGSWGDVKGLTE